MVTRRSRHWFSIIEHKLFTNIRNVSSNHAPNKKTRFYHIVHNQLQWIMSIPIRSPLPINLHPVAWLHYIWTGLGARLDHQNNVGRLSRTETELSSARRRLYGLNNR